MSLLFRVKTIAVPDVTTNIKCHNKMWQQQQQQQSWLSLLRQSCSYGSPPVGRALTTTTTSIIMSQHVPTTQGRKHHPPSKVHRLLSSLVGGPNHHAPKLQRWPPIVVPHCDNNNRSFHTTPYRPSEASAAAAATTTDVTTAASSDDNSMPPILWTTHRLTPQQIQKVDAIFQKILWLDLFEASMLNEVVNEKMGVALTNKQRRQLGQLMEQRELEAAGNVGGGGSSGDGPAEDVEVGPVLVDMKLASFDAASKIKVIKEVRSILNLGLKEAKELVESAPVTLQKGMKQELADELKAKLEAAGAKIDIV